MNSPVLFSVSDPSNEDVTADTYVHGRITLGLLGLLVGFDAEVLFGVLADGLFQAKSDYFDKVNFYLINLYMIFSDHLSFIHKIDNILTIFPLKPRIEVFLTSYPKIFCTSTPSLDSELHRFQRF